MAEAPGASPLRETAAFFLKLGTTAFGGPAAHLALMEDEAVRRRGWLSREELLDLMGACSLIPGPSSSQVAMLVGHRRAGWRGLLLGGLCFILPAALLTLALAWAYQRFGHLPGAAALLAGVKPVILAVVVQALWGLGRVVVRRPPMLGLALLALAASLLGVHPALVMLGAATLPVLAVLARRGPGRGMTAGLAALPSLPVLMPALTLTSLFGLFAKFGVLVFGSGYVLLAYLQADLVDRLHWLTRSQLLDAIAAGQVTPGPVFTTATFIGYLVKGTPGAVVATAGIFLPSFLMTLALAPLLPRLRRSGLASAFLDGANAGALGLMAAVSWAFLRTAVAGWMGLAIFALAAALLLRWRVNPTWLILGGAAAGLLLR